jgi:hypothetical protein
MSGREIDTAVLASPVPVRDNRNWTARKGASTMRLRKQRPPPAPPPQETAKPTKPPWQEFLDPQERPNREDLAAQHNVFTDTLLEPVPMPRWLRGRRRAPRDK